jgi:ferrous iron transport protein A
MPQDHQAWTGMPAAALGQSKCGYKGHVQAIKVLAGYCDLPEGELERRLIELGFIEGAQVEILHEGLFGRDPIAVRVNGNTVALRRREAMAIVVEAAEPV